MLQNRYHICVPTTDLVKVKKWSTTSTEPDILPNGKFNQDKITPTIQEIIKNPANLKDGQIQKVGEALFEALFDKGLREDFLSFYTDVKNKKQILQVILEINEIAMPEVVAYPWELMCLPEKYNQGDIYFATDRKLSFFRCRYQLKEEAKQPIKLNKGEPLKIALVVSKPTSDPDLNNVEFREVSEYLKSLNDKPENKVKFLSLMNSDNFSQIVKRLEEDAPDIFHFIGHGQLIEKSGEDIGQIAFVNDAGQADWKDAKMFSQLFSGHTPNIVILQACETGKQSETNAFSSVASRLMLQGIPVVIAMQYKVSNQTATTFVKEFYSQIIEGDSVEVAVQKSRSKLAMDNGYEKRDFAIPVIYMNAVEGYLVQIQKKEISDNKILSLAQRLKKESLEERLKILEKDYKGFSRDYNQAQSITRRLERERLEERLKILEKDYKDISSDYNLAHDTDEKNRLESKLNRKKEEIQKVEQELNEFKNDFIKELILVLETYFNNEKDTLLSCYKQSLPDRSIHTEVGTPENVTKIISSLLRPMEEDTYSYVNKFILHLLDDEKVSLQLQLRLQEWATENINNYTTQLRQLQQEQQRRRDESNPCLIVAIKSQLHEYNEYIVNAWLIKNIDQYQNYGSGCQQLNIDNPHTDKNLASVEEMVRTLIQQCITITNNEPQEIHIFLPLKLMNHPVDCWKMYEDERETIGEKYQIFIRCSEGLIGKNPRVIAWQKKGKLISENLSRTANEIFFMAADTKVETLEKQLKIANARAAKIIPVFQNNLPGEILWKAAVPLALWVRQELSGIDNRTVLDELINDFDLKELPEKVRLKRLDAMDQNPEENHVGRHLCLLWDDPNLLPPQQNLTDTKL